MPPKTGSVLTYFADQNHKNHPQVGVNKPAERHSDFGSFLYISCYSSFTCGDRFVQHYVMWPLDNVDFFTFKTEIVIVYNICIASTSKYATSKTRIILGK